MILTTKYNIGDLVWVVNGKTGQAVCREVQGIRTQFLGDTQKTIYSFLKDKFDANSKYFDYLGYDPVAEQDKYFWMSEDKCYESKQELLNSL